MTTFEDSKIRQLEDELKAVDDQLKAKEKQLEVIVAHLKSTEKELVAYKTEYNALIDTQSGAAPGGVTTYTIPRPSEFSEKKTTKEKVVIVGLWSAITLGAVAVFSGVAYGIVSLVRKDDEEEVVS